MRYRVKMMSKDEVYITEEEYQSLISKNAKGLVFVPSLKSTLNMNSIESILHEDAVPEKESTEGRLHDGTRVIKQFGVWRDAVNPNLTLDPRHYPEIANDNVMSEENYLEKQGVRAIGRVTSEMISN